MGNTGSAATNMQRVTQGLPTPPEQQDLILRLLGTELWEVVLAQLTVKDLAALQRVSKATKVIKC